MSAATPTPGVRIGTGVRPWQILQQGADGTADVVVGGSWERVRLSAEVPIAFTAVHEGRARIRARVAAESSGASVVPWQDCEVDEDGTWSAVLRAVPAGGLYRVETTMEYEGWDGLSATRGDVVHGIGVGDVYIVAGQSNAAGRAKDPVDDGPELGVHQFRNDGSWGLATHPLNETTASVHLGHFENHNPGHGPALRFAKQLRSELGYPVGLIMAAYGGAPLRWWNPEQNGALTRNMLDMVEASGGGVRGVIWYQGEADGFEETGADYLERFAAWVAGVRSALREPELPIFTVQLNRCTSPTTLDRDRAWGLVREAQRRAGHELGGVYTVPANDLPLYDFIHLSAAGNIVLGERLARAVSSVIAGRAHLWRAPEPVSAVRVAPAKVALTLAPVVNWINDFDLVGAGLPFEAEDADGFVAVRAHRIEGATIELEFERELGKGAVLHGMWRMAGAQPVPTDCMRLPVMSFYAFPIEGA